MALGDNRIASIYRLHSDILGIAMADIYSRNDPALQRQQLMQACQCGVQLQVSTSAERMLHQAGIFHSLKL